MVSRAIAVPANLDRDGLEVYRQGIEALLTHLSDAAEAWANAGDHRAGQQRVKKEPSRVAFRTAGEPGDPGVALGEELARHGLSLAEPRAAA